MGYLIGTIRDRLLKQNVGLTEEHSIFLFINRKLMNSFKEKIGVFWASNKEEDDILYLEYSD